MSASSKKKLRKEQNAAQLTEKQLSEQKEARNLKTYTIIFTVVIALVILLAVGIMVNSAIQNSGIFERNTVALTVDDHKITAAELSYFFVDSINALYSDMYSTYGDYTMSYLQMLYGLNLTVPLDQQYFDETSGQTYADYFADLSVQDAVVAYRCYDLAVKEGITISEEEQGLIDQNLAEVSAIAKAQNYSVTEYLQGVYGRGASEETFRKYLEVRGYANSYMGNVFNGLVYEDSVLEAFSNEHFDNYSSFSYAMFNLNASTFVECTASEEDTEHKHTPAELAAAATAAGNAASSLISAQPTNVEEFNAAIKGLEAYAADENAVCTTIENKLLTDITVEDIAEWIVGDLQPGTMELFTQESTTTDDAGKESTYISQYTVVLFLGRNDNYDELVDVRHILVPFEGGTTDENGKTIYSDAAKQAALDRIETLRDTWLTGEATEESFAVLATDNSTDPGSVNNGGLYENVFPGKMVPAFNDWCFEEGRKTGDYGIVETDFGYHLIYFVGESGINYRTYMIENEMRNDDYTAWFDTLTTEGSYTVGDTSRLPRSKIMYAYSY